MALSQATRDKIVRLTNKHWANPVKTAKLAKIARGKEPGQKMAHYVDGETTTLLKNNLKTRQEGNRNGSRKKRSMGDLWVHSSGIFNPVNIKTGEQGKKSQPNVVSMQKLLDYIFRFEIDSYYLLIIKFNLAKKITHKVYLVDLLDWTDYITFNAGPGQILLSEKKFYAAYESRKWPKQRPIAKKVESLYTLFEKKVNSLIASRRQRLNRQRKLFENFPNKRFAVNQSKITFVP